MIYNYHTHTYRCSHATGTQEEYVIRAIENGIKYMGFSDHIPLEFPDGSQSNYRVPVNQGKIYCEEIKELAEKYKDKVEIKVGFEAEYYPEYFDKMLKSAIEYGAEYLILGQHFIGPENVSLIRSIDPTDNIETFKKYVQLVIEAMQTKAFTYIAHPDILNFTGDEEIYKSEMHKLCIASRELNIPLEINFLGIRDNRNYPNDVFWSVVGEEKAPVTFGFDAHDVLSAFDGESLKVAKNMVKNFNLNYIGKPNIINIQNVRNGL